MPPFGSDKSFNSLYTLKEPTLSESSTTKSRGDSSSRDTGIYNLSNPFIKKPASQNSSSSIIFGLGTSLKSNVGADLTLDSSKNKTVVGQNAGTSQNIVEQITQDSKENLNPDVTKSATAPEKVVEDVIKKINKAEASYNYIPPSFETFLLQNSKNKVLFNFTRPTFSYNLNIVSPIDQSMIPQFSGQTTISGMSNAGLDENPNLIPLEQAKTKQIDISNFSLLFYKTKNKPSSIEEMTSQANLFKELTPAKKELSVIDFLDVNTDYYFYVIPDKNLIDKISSLIVTEFDLSLGYFKVTTAGEKGILSDYVYKVRVIKDGELYFLEKEAINLKEIKDTKKTKSFYGTLLIEPKYDFVNSTIKKFAQKNSSLPFTISDSVFDSGDNYPYIKLRFKSKKSNRKVDVNLKYTVLNSDPVKLTEDQVGQVRTEKYTKLESVPVIVPTMFIGDIKYSNFFVSTESRLSVNQFIENIEKIVKQATDGKVKVFTEILKNDNQLTDFIFQPAVQKDIDDILNFTDKETPVHKLIKLAKLEAVPPNQEPSYKISKASLGNFLTSQDSKEKDLLKKFINELNSYYSSDNSKSIINVYNGKDDALYSFIGYTKQDLDKFINDYSDDNYLKQIYVNLIKNIEPGKDIIGDAILQL